jgi:uncharacterized protein
MASTNQSPQYHKAEAAFLSSKSDDEKLHWLDEMIKLSPKHKSAEKMLANLKTRRKKLLEKIESGKKSGKSKGRPGIKKEDMQAVIVGFTNSGKSTLLNLLTNVKTKIASYNFTTKEPIVGMFDFQGTKIQLIEIPAVNSEFYDKGIVNTADTILILVNSLADISGILEEINIARGKKLVVFNLNGLEDKRKIEATLKSKKYSFSIVNLKTGEGVDSLKERIFKSFDKIRIYTKEPSRNRSERPLILDVMSTVREVAEKIIKDISKIKETKIWGPSSKFPGQIVGLHHGLKDLDVVEFRTR